MIKLLDILTEMRLIPGVSNEWQAARCFENVYQALPTTTATCIKREVVKHQSDYEAAKNSGKVEKMNRIGERRLSIEAWNTIIGDSNGKLVSSPVDTIAIMKYSNPDLSNTYVIWNREGNINNLTFCVGAMVTTTFNEYIHYSPTKIIKLANIEQIWSSYIATEFRRKGYGKMVYDALLSNVDAVYSDSTLFSGAFAMWANHIKKKSKFFGIVCERGLVLPIDANTDVSGNMINNENAYRGFIAVYTNVPAPLVQLSRKLKNIHPDDIQFVPRHDDVFDQDELDILEDASSFDELQKHLQRGFSLKPNMVVILQYENANVMLREKANEIQAVIL